METDTFLDAYNLRMSNSVPLSDIINLFKNQIARNTQSITNERIIYVIIKLLRMKIINGTHIYHYEINFYQYMSNTMNKK